MRTARQFRLLAIVLWVAVLAAQLHPDATQSRAMRVLFASLCVCVLAVPGRLMIQSSKETRTRPRRPRLESWGWAFVAAGALAFGWVTQPALSSESQVSRIGLWFFLGSFFAMPLFYGAIGLQRPKRTRVVHTTPPSREHAAAAPAPPPASPIPSPPAAREVDPATVARRRRGRRMQQVRSSREALFAVLSLSWLFGFGAFGIGQGWKTYEDSLRGGILMTIGLAPILLLVFRSRFDRASWHQRTSRASERLADRVRRMEDELVEEIDEPAVLR